ncbi:hypothetical protein [Moorena sp. SIO3A2]|uniref:hypothetical protein n=1 Tax=Moorena sp. SIO3A2 TaxID=2607841 RepID=UPI0013BAC4D5|nr:hypothetical protein [Moorena sp. SIO3A2]NER90315.1 hypothetical protein [Moorena sp. SIO3A2]
MSNTEIIRIKPRILKMASEWFANQLLDVYREKDRKQSFSEETKQHYLTRIAKVKQEFEKIVSEEWEKKWTSVSEAHHLSVLLMTEDYKKSTSLAYSTIVRTSNEPLKKILSAGGFKAEDFPFIKINVYYYRFYGQIGNERFNSDNFKPKPSKLEQLAEPVGAITFSFVKAIFKILDIAISIGVIVFLIKIALWLFNLLFGF